jgi:hypothetical protein
MLGAILVSITVGPEGVAADSSLRSTAWEKRMLGASFVGSRLFKHPTNKATVTHASFQRTAVWKVKPGVDLSFS